MATNPSTLIGKRISLVSKLNIRYEGILYSVDPAAQSVALANVRSFGTEERESVKFIPPSQDVYEFIIFRGSDIQDLLVPSDKNTMSPAPRPQYDPAIVASGAGMHNQNPYYLPPSTFGMGLPQNQPMPYPNPYGNWGGYGTWEPNRQQQFPSPSPMSQLGPPIGPPLGMPLGPKAHPYLRPQDQQQQFHPQQQNQEQPNRGKDYKDDAFEEQVDSTPESVDSNADTQEDGIFDNVDENTLEPPNLVQQVDKADASESFFDLPGSSANPLLGGDGQAINTVDENDTSDNMFFQNQLYPLEENKKENRQHKPRQQQNPQRQQQQRPPQNRRQGPNHSRRPNQDASPSSFTRKDERQGIGRGKRVVNTSQWKEREARTIAADAGTGVEPVHPAAIDTEVKIPTTMTTNPTHQTTTQTKTSSNYRDRGRNNTSRNPRTKSPNNNSSSNSNSNNPSPGPRRPNTRGGGGGGGGRGNAPAQPGLFDFEEATAAFDKESVFQNISQQQQQQDDLAEEEDCGAGYDSTSFFDTLSCEATERTTNAKPLDRAEQRKLDVETFGAEANKIRYGRPNRSSNTNTHPGGNRENPNPTNATAPSSTTSSGRSTTNRGGRGRNANSPPRNAPNTVNNSNGSSSPPSPDNKAKRFAGRGRRGNTNTNKVFRQKNTGANTETPTHQDTEVTSTGATTPSTPPPDDNSSQQQQ